MDGHGASRKKDFRQATDRSPMPKLKNKIKTFIGRRLLPDALHQPLARRRWQKRLKMESRTWNEWREGGERLVHILHIGKTGGTAIRHAFRDLEKANGYRFIFHPHQMTLPEVPEGDLAIIFFRDPVARFMSSFKSRLNQGSGRYFSPWTRTEEEAFKEFPTPGDLARALESDDPAIQKKAFRSMKNIRHVKNHYTHWCRSTEYLEYRSSDIALIGFQETLADDIDLMEKKFGLTGHELPTDKKSAHRSSGPEYPLDNEAEENIRSWYAMDIEIEEWARCNSKRINLEMAS